MGDRMRELRLSRGWSQDEVAAQLGVTRQAISQWERGVREPRAFMLVFFARLYNVTTDWLLGVEK